MTDFEIPNIPDSIPEASATDWVGFKQVLTCNAQMESKRMMFRVLCSLARRAKVAESHIANLSVTK